MVLPHMKGRRWQRLWLARGTALGLVVLSSGAGCQLFRNLGTGVRYDPPDDKPASNKSKVVHDILLDVTTDAAGAVTQVQFKRSSGVPERDQYIADSTRANWKGAPLTRTRIELTYSGENGFSVPKIISTEHVTP